MAFFVSIYLVGLIGFFLHLYRTPASERTKERTVELFLLYQIVFSLGVTSIVSFFGLTFMAEYVAAYTNWPSCPFEQQLANVNLGFGVLGILSIWYRGLFWAATIIGFSIWIFGDGIHHFILAVRDHNLSDGNIGVPLWTDIIVPLLLLVLLWMYKPTKRSR